MSLFLLDNVEFSSRTQKIIKGVSMEIEQGQVVGLLGKSGSGKSTLLKIISGILVPTAGKVLFDGRNIRLMSRGENKKFRKRCSFVFQDSALWENQTIAQNLNLPLQTHNQSMSEEERMEIIGNVCSLVGYTRSLSLRPVDLSMGEKKLVAFARAFINNPDVLFLDECTESLDIQNSDRIVSLIADFIRKGNTVAYVSHKQNFVDTMISLGESGRSVIYDVDNGFLKGFDNYEI